MFEILDPSPILADSALQLEVHEAAAIQQENSEAKAQKNANAGPTIVDLTSTRSISLKCLSDILIQLDEEAEEAGDFLDSIHAEGDNEHFHS